MKALPSPELAGELALGRPVPVVEASGSQALGDWWNADLDRDLLKGTLKHGYGNHGSRRRPQGMREPSTIKMDDREAEEEGTMIKLTGNGGEDVPEATGSPDKLEEGAQRR